MQVRAAGLEVAPAEESCLSVTGKRHVHENRWSLRNSLTRCV